MGTAQAQGELWGAKASDWAEFQEPSWKGVYDAGLSAAGVTAGTRLLDIGCGAGGALAAARERGVDVAGLDASQQLVAVARARLPGARIETGEMEELPFEAGSFDTVTGFNAFQFAGDAVAALREARRVCKADGRVFLLVWGHRDDCDLLSATMPAVLALLPPPPNPAPPVAWAERGVIEGLMHRARIAPAASGDISAEFRYRDAEFAWRAISAAAPVARAVRFQGEATVRQAVCATFAPFAQADGAIVQRNRFRWVHGSPA